MASQLSLRQKVSRFFYPLLMWAGGRMKKFSTMESSEIQPYASVYDLSFTGIDGAQKSLRLYVGKKILLVNTASNCGFTAQYEALETLSRTYNDQLVVLGFPSNDFKNQESAGNDEIAAFCKINFGVTFPLAQKSSVKKSPGQNPVFKWLSEPALNGWNKEAPTWNFCKYLVNEKGRLTHFFESAVDPLSPQVIDAITQIN